MCPTVFQGRGKLLVQNPDLPWAAAFKQTQAERFAVIRCLVEQGVQLVSGSDAGVNFNAFSDYPGDLILTVEGVDLSLVYVSNRPHPSPQKPWDAVTWASSHREKLPTYWLSRAIPCTTSVPSMRLCLSYRVDASCTETRSAEWATTYAVATVAQTRARAAAAERRGGSSQRTTGSSVQPRAARRAARSCCVFSASTVQVLASIITP